MAKKTTRAKKRTLSEFKAWLQGIEELQPDDWCPTLDQWQLIRRSIENITEEEPRVVEVPVREARPAPVAPYVGPTPAAPAPAPAPPGTVPAGVPVPPVAPSGIPADAGVEMSEEAKKLLGGAGPAQPGQPRKTKTPDIDTADGSYQSTFS